ncbi:MAG: regulatory protein RecX [Candidatus Krumholzibacteriia bacterium]
MDAAAGEPILVACRREESVVMLVLDDGETLELAPDALPSDLPAAGTPVPAALLEKLREAAARKILARRIFALLDRRPWTVARLRRKLGGEGFSSAVIDAVLARFVAEELVSDRRFADAFCRDALRAKPVGTRWLRARLTAQGVPADTAAAAAGEALPPEAERELARAAAAARWRRGGAGRGPAATARVARFLTARGFPPAVAGRAARETAPAGGNGRDGAPDAPGEDDDA